MSGQKGFKKTKFEERILAELNSHLRMRVSDKRLQMISITKVELNNDFSEAKVYWDSFDEQARAQAQEGLDAAKGRLRTHLAQAIQARHMPYLSFFYDSQFESEKEIENILADESKKGRSF